MRVNPGDPRLLQDFIAAKLSLSRRGAKEIIDARRAWVNRKCVWMARARLESGDVVEISNAIPKPPVKFHVRVIWSNDNYLVCDKPAGLSSCGETKSVESILRTQENNPDLAAVHRLDRDTTGCLLVAKNRAAMDAAIEIFKTHKVLKIYNAIVAGRFKYAHQKIETPLDGQPAVSVVARESVGDEASFLRVRIETGRTNQIRRHLASVRYPVLGDRIFGLKSARDPRLLRVPRQMLHAATLELPDPMDPRSQIRAHAPLPSDFRAALKLFGMGKRG